MLVIKDDDNTLNRIATALEEINVTLKQILGERTPNLLQNVQNTSFGSLELEFFSNITQVYVEEERIKVEKNLKRKSAVRVSNELGIRMVNFFNRHLTNLTALTYDGYILFKKEDENKALFRFQTDLGFNRGEAYYDAIKHGVELAKKLGVPISNLFFMIGSIHNSIDNSHVKKILGTTDIPDNSILLSPSYHDLLVKYLNAYIESIPYLVNPHKQIFLLTSSVHPNVLAWEIFNKNQSIPQNIKFLEPSVTELIKTLELI
ncbi:hypothetical protein [Cytobacillus dafuensis]|uniref:Uncharacterized protein n=1 Tax=Cytobacillus dafuensis TaxID=1742359 RepID=A0A5B8Z0Y6_CYTDA|nr:hypothetical protein [Cytobacillus dafuensis]QED46387.1 hypothetical protein FSZ17_03385 [Cytobacillus dafuensis]